MNYGFILHEVMNVSTGTDRGNFDAFRRCAFARGSAVDWIA